MAYYDDFIGFQFGEYHFPDKDAGFMLYRVSDGSRYTDPSVAQFNDTKTTIPGGDGTYYWDSFYTQRAFTVLCAFDSLTEAQIRKIRQIFNGKAENWLIFDETPFKKYRVKMQSPPQLKYLAFNEGEGKERVYKGELTLNFVSYTPYGIDTFKYISSAVDTSVDTSAASAASISKYYWYENGALKFSSNATGDANEWLPSLELLDSDPNRAEFVAEYKVYNPGDLPTDWVATVSCAGTSYLKLELIDENQAAAESLTLDGISFVSDDVYLQVDSAKNLVYGLDANQTKTGNLYNKYITDGDFFKIPVSTSSESIQTIIALTSTDTSVVGAALHVDFNYLYY